MIIYKTTNLINGKIYIGQDSNNNPNYLGSGSIFIKAIKKHGESNFKKEILEYCNSKEELNERETYWIKFYNATNNEIGYNVSEGGLGVLGFKHSEEWKSKVSERMIVNNPFRGKNHSIETKLKISNANKGKTLSDETRSKIGLIHKGKLKSDAHKDKMRIYGSNPGSKNGMYGKKHTVESNIKNSETQKLLPKIICKYCNKSSNQGNINRWHNEKCKLKI